MGRFGSSLDRAECMISNFQDRYIENTQTEAQLGEKTKYKRTDLKRHVTLSKGVIYMSKNQVFRENIKRIQIKQAHIRLSIAP